jgi:ankyrin repeat protein
MSISKEELLLAYCKTGNLQEIKQLVEKGVDLHHKNDYALRWASCYGQLEIVKYLIEKGLNLCAEDDSALHWAIDAGRTKTVNYLKKQILLQKLKEIA